VRTIVAYAWYPCWDSSVPIKMESEHSEGGAVRVVVSPDNRTILSGGVIDLTIHIHDSET